MVVRMRHNRGQTGSRRSHHALKTAVLSLCIDCGSPKKPHDICTVCGKYKGKQIVDVHTKIAKKNAKAKEKAKKAGK